MVDTIARDTTTTATLAVGSSASSFIDQFDLNGNVIDADYFRVSLIAGHNYQFTGNANVSFVDTLDAIFMRIRDAAGTILAPDVFADSATPFFNFTPSSSGTYYLAVSAGGAGAFQDKTGGYTVALADVTPPPPQPDLVASLNSVSTTSALAGSNLTVNYTISNTGAGTAANSFGLVYLSTNAIFGDADDIALNAVNLPGTGTLGAGGSIAQSQSVTLPSFLSAGTYFLGVKADALNNLVSESNEGNNFSTLQSISISNPMPLPAVSIADATIGEGGTLSFAVTLDKVWNTDVLVNFNVTGGTATSGSDYFAPGASSVTIFAGSQTANISINTINDGVTEPNETVNLQLFGPLGANLGTKTTAVGTIIDAGGTVTPPPPPVTFKLGTDYNFLAGKWDHQNITWHYDPSQTPFNNPLLNFFKGEIQQAFEKWAATSPLTFTEVSNPNSADIDLSWNFIDGNSNILAQAGPSPTGPVLAPQNITFDNSEFWTWNGADYLLSGGGSFYAVALHEIGHAIGLDHPSSTKTLMSALISAATRDLTPADIFGINLLYGSGFSSLFSAASDVVHIVRAGAIWHALSGNDKVFGSSGNDLIFGDSGKDFLSGRAGDDILAGGLGTDLLTGGSGHDTFLYLSKIESRTGTNHRDIIFDFKHRQDKIDFSNIDANVKLNSDQNFKFISQSAFHHRAGELHYRYEDGTKTIVEGDVNGDGKADRQPGP